MAYRCSNCGKFIKKDAKECKCCGQKNPQIINEDENPNSQKIVSKKKYIKCPFCGSRIEYTENLSSNNQIVCLRCNNVIDNPYYKVTIWSFIRNHFKAIYFSILAICLIIILCNQQKSTPSPQLSKDWEVAAQNQDFEFAEDKDLPSTLIDNLEKRSGRSLCSLFDSYINKPIINQEILFAEPLRSLIIQCVGEDKLSRMATFLLTDEGLTKTVTDHTNYTYDCYEDTPNGNYFSFAYLCDNTSKSFYLEVKIDNKMYNASVDKYN